MRVAVASAAKREQAFSQNADVYVTNTDAVRWLVKQKPSFFKDFDVLIIDEITTFKHHTSKRSKALNKIKKHFLYRYGLTGTPTTVSVTDLWHPVQILDDGKRLGTSFYQFRAAVCTPVQVGPSAEMVRWDDKPGAEVAVAGLLGDFVVRHVFEECIDIPPNTITQIPYALSAKQQRVYNDMERDAVTMLANGQVLSAVNAATVMGKLLQIASGAAYSEAGIPALVDTGRYELAAELAEQRRHSIIFFQWTHQRDELIRELESRGLTFAVIDGSTPDKARKDIVSEYQKGFYRVLLAHPASAAHGLTLTRGTTTIWASPTSNLEHWLQGNRRIYRAGQTERTETIVLTARGTIEEKVLAKLEDKNTRQINLLELLQ